MLGITIYQRYNPVTDWSAVIDNGVTFAYIKGMGTGGTGSVPPRAYVDTAKNAGLWVGLYHHAQLAPSPEAQADSLAVKALALGATDLPLALDLADPFQADKLARDFVERFMRRLVDHHRCTRAVLCAGLSTLWSIQAVTLDIPELWFWVAARGLDNRTHYPVDHSRMLIHQYTPKSRVPGINRVVGLNWARPNLVPLSGLGLTRIALPAPQEG